VKSEADDDDTLSELSIECKPDLEPSEHAVDPPLVLKPIVREEVPSVAYAESTGEIKNASLLPPTSDSGRALADLRCSSEEFSVSLEDLDEDVEDERVVVPSSAPTHAPTHAPRKLLDSEVSVSDESDTGSFLGSWSDNSSRHSGAPQKKPVSRTEDRSNGAVKVGIREPAEVDNSSIALSDEDSDAGSISAPST
jgi:hypothetical protein